MGEDLRHPGEREAERIRIIVETLAHACPDLPMSIAAETVFKIEKRTAELESVKVNTGLFELPDGTPETIARYIDLRPKIVEEITEGRKINAIKSVRGETTYVGNAAKFTGLKESKEGVEEWERQYKARAMLGTSSPTVVSKIPTPADIATWIDHDATTRIMLTDYMSTIATSGPSTPGVSSKKISAIKEVRYRCTLYPTLTEARDGVEEWLRINS